MKKHLITILFCAVFIGLLCMASLLCDEVQAAEPEKDPHPISAEVIYLKDGYQTFNLNVQKKYPDLQLTYYPDPNNSMLPDYQEAFTVDQEGNVTMLTDQPGHYVVFVHSDETELAMECTIQVLICIELKDQTLIGPKKLTVDYGKTVKLRVKAKTRVSYRSDTPDIAKVNSDGVVTFRRPGRAVIVAVAESDSVYKANGLVIRITCRLKKPSLKAFAGTGRVKLRWGQVPGAQKYLIYVKYPGSRKYRLATKQPARVRGITHRNLKKGKRYSYKVRAYMKLKGRKYYSPYSKAVTVKVR